MRLDYLLALAILLGLTGCKPPMANDSVIEEVKKCEAAGLDAVGMVQGMSGPIVMIQCQPKGTSK